MPAADYVTEQRVGQCAEIGVRRELFLRRGDAQRLLDRGFDLVVQQVDARLQALVLIDQRVADQNARHAAVALGEAEEQGEDLLDLPQTLCFLRFNAVDDAEQARFDELDQAVEHLRLAGEVAIERGFGTIEPSGEGGGRDLLAFGCLQHPGQRLQDLQLSFARLAHVALSLIDFLLVLSAESARL